MESVGVRELREHTSEIIRRVHEHGEEVKVTRRGKVVAKIVPAEDLEDTKRRSAAVWARLDKLAEKISAVWPQGVSAVEAVREQRREL